MARVCDVCKKEYMRGNQVSHGIGQRVTRRSKRTQRPNLRVKRIDINGKKVKVRICASCLKRLKFEERKQSEENVE